MKDSIHFYKIKDTKTGLYSTGGVNPKFTKKGKVWNNIGHVKSHITLIKQHLEHLKNAQWIPPKHKKELEISMASWKIEEYIFEKADIKIIPISDLLLQMGLF